MTSARPTHAAARTSANSTDSTRRAPRENRTEQAARKPRHHRGRGPATGGRPPAEPAPRVPTAGDRTDPLAGLDLAPAVDPNAAVPSWRELGLPERLVLALEHDGLITPFPIQARTLPDALTGRDLLGRGRTGSGKTLGFGLPMLTRLAADAGRPLPRRPRALVLVPTRELANQVDAALAPLGQALRLRTRTVVGGVSYGKQIRALDQGVDVLVATPGRLTDLIRQGACDLSDTKIVVLDEADQMCDMGFLPAVRDLLSKCPNGQRLLFSATLDRQVTSLVKEHLHDPVVHALTSGADPIVEMEHHVLSVSGPDKAAVVHALAQRTGRTLMFVRTKHGADRLAKQLTRDGVPSGALHGNLNQNARTRALSAFSDGSVPVLVATDVAARGLHVDDVDLVVHVDPPTEHKTYLHRSGRTARAGAAGRVVTIALPDQAGAVRGLLKQASVQVTPVRTAPGDEHLAALRGEQADLVPFQESAARAVAAQQVSRPSSGASRFGSRDGGRNGSGSSGRGQGRSPNAGRSASRSAGSGRGAARPRTP